MHAEPASPAEISSRVIDEAISWAVRINFSHASVKTEQAFETWLHAAPVHQSAWHRIQSLRQDFARVPPELALDALQSADARRNAASVSRRQALRLLSLCAFTSATGLAVHGSSPWQNLLADASTAVGQQRTVQLDDGTTIVLNTDSAISSELSGQRRVVVLHRGEILITTGGEAQFADRRPFWVHTPFGTMQALGTRFVVRLEPHGARVSVTEGAVQIHPGDNALVDNPVVKAGESWWLAEAGAQPASALPFDNDGWVDGVIAGKNMRLADLVAELSRYRSGRVVCDDQIADLRVSGVYHLRNTDQALQFLAQTQPVRVRYLTRFWVTLGPL